MNATWCRKKKTTTKRKADPRCLCGPWPSLALRVTFWCWSQSPFRILQTSTSRWTAALFSPKTAWIWPIPSSMTSTLIYHRFYYCNYFATLFFLLLRADEFLGYTASDLEGRSAYDFHHVLDHDVVMKSYKTSKNLLNHGPIFTFALHILFFFALVFAKGQVETPPYRFLARRGGYVWVQTQATLVYGSSRDSNKPQAVVCVHTCLR